MYYESKDISFPYYGYLSYRIQIDMSQRQHFQRHIWRVDGSIFEEVEGWIPTYITSQDVLLQRGYTGFIILIQPL
jgi:hypothetical protein